MWLEAVRAAEEKQAHNIKVLDLRDVTTFADYFVILSGSNTRQLQAIADAIRASVKDKWIGHQINTAKFVPPPRPMYSIGG